MNWLSELRQKTGALRCVEVHGKTVYFPVVKENTSLGANPRHTGILVHRRVELDYLREFSRKHSRVIYGTIDGEVLYYFCPRFDSQHELLEALKTL